jgi:hypothetical protein
LIGGDNRHNVRFYPVRSPEAQLATPVPRCGLMFRLWRRRRGASGSDDYWTKPYGPIDLLRLVWSYLGRDIGKMPIIEIVQARFRLEHP